MRSQDEPFRQESTWRDSTDEDIIRSLQAETQREEGIRNFNTGEDITKELYGPGRRSNVNVIPGEPTARCYGRLDVVVGRNDSLELRILQAIEHSAFRCLNDKIVVFRTAQWEPSPWLKYVSRFRDLNCRVFRKDFRSPNVIRLVP
jgi:hypothetical protein